MWKQPELSELLDKGLWPAACQGAQGSTLTILISSIQGGRRGFGSGIFNLNWHHSCLSSNSKMTLPQLGRNIVAQDSRNPAWGKAPRMQGQPYQSQGQWACPSPLQLFPCLSSLPPGGRQLPTANCRWSKSHAGKKMLWPAEWTQKRQPGQPQRKVTVQYWSPCSHHIWREGHHHMLPGSSKKPARLFSQSSFTFHFFFPKLIGSPWIPAERLWVSQKEEKWSRKTPNEERGDLGSRLVY